MRQGTHLAIAGFLGALMGLTGYTGEWVVFVVAAAVFLVNLYVMTLKRF